MGNKIIEDKQGNEIGRIIDEKARNKERAKAKTWLEKERRLDEEAKKLGMTKEEIRKRRTLTGAKTYDQYRMLLKVFGITTIVSAIIAPPIAYGSGCLFILVGIMYVSWKRTLNGDHTK
ncbi:MAG: hypothetical protein CMD23_01120 [Flavobacteriales bacterium]|nr:hypothetical protein [Flavobacteriales bacterium]|tara:strand:- start:1476 stop:1832 length:357 start_codon:yes stop_codon:yes gene_type:complete